MPEHLLTRLCRTEHGGQTLRTATFTFAGFWDQVATLLPCLRPLPLCGTPHSRYHIYMPCLPAGLAARLFGSPLATIPGRCRLHRAPGGCNVARGRSLAEINTAWLATAPAQGKRGPAAPVRWKKNRDDRPIIWWPANYAIGKRAIERRRYREWRISWRIRPYKHDWLFNTFGGCTCCMLIDGLPGRDYLTFISWPHLATPLRRLHHARANRARPRRAVRHERQASRAPYRERISLRFLLPTAVAYAAR